MKNEKTGIEIWTLDREGGRCALAVNGLVRFVGARDQCERRAQILIVVNDRNLQDMMLVRALG
jgi:hypothetical protein